MNKDKDIIKVICRANGCEFYGNRYYKYLYCPECQAQEGFYLEGIDL